MCVCVHGKAQYQANRLINTSWDLRRDTRFGLNYENPDYCAAAAVPGLALLSRNRYPPHTHMWCICAQDYTKYYIHATRRNPPSSLRCWGLRRDAGLSTGITTILSLATPPKRATKSMRAYGTTLEYMHTTAQSSDDILPAARRPKSVAGLGVFAPVMRGDGRLAKDARRSCTRSPPNVCESLSRGAVYYVRKSPSSERNGVCAALGKGKRGV